MALPSEDVLRELVARYAHVLAAHGDAFEGAELVTPTGKHFPDRFSWSDPSGRGARDGKSLGRLLQRVVSYTPLGENVPLEIALIDDAGDDGHCTSGCAKPGARVDGAEAIGDGYRVPLPTTELANPTRLVCALARGVLAAVLAETGDEVDPEDVGAWSEVFAVASGFGVVLLEGSYVYAKSCGGPSIHQGTAHSPRELAFMLALFCAVTETSQRDARKHLGATQAEAFDEAWAFVRKNESIVRKLREAPELLEGGAFSFDEKRGLFSRLLSSSEEAPKPRADRPQKEVDPELRALVEEELRS